MGMGAELDLIREGNLADMLLVDGDPQKDVRILQDRKRLVSIMKDGNFPTAPEHASSETWLFA
ncbi:MAG: hypothetical protein ACTSX7_19975 [Alphaproteobacteria bacterium]